MPKGQDQGGVLDRLRRRIDNYRKHHEEVGPRHDNTTSSQNQQQKQDTLLLRQRFLETNKAKKSAKKSDKKQHSESGGSSIGPSKSNKRQNEDDQGGGEGYEPPAKIGGAGRGTSSPLPSNATNSSLYKQGFSQNGKRGGSKTKALDSQKYQASSSNHPKNGIGRIPPPNSNPNPPIPPNIINFSTQSASSVPEFKKESTSSLSDFADLDQCAAALEKDAAKNGAITGSFMGENSTDEIFNSDVFNDLISEISDLNPDVMSNFYLDDGPPTADDLNDVTLHGSAANGACNTNEPFHPVTPVTPTTSSPMRSTTVSHGHLSAIKMEGGGVDGTSIGVHAMDRGLSHCAGPSPAPASTASPLASQLGSSHQPSPSQSYNSSHFVLDNGQTGSPLNNQGVVNSCNSGNTMTKPSTRLPYSSPAGIPVDSPAAQTLKHMAEQHQHKAQMCMNTSSATNGGVPFKNQGSVGSPVGSPYGSMGSYNGSMSSDYSGPTNNMNPGSNCQVKQEVCSPGNPQAGFSPSPMMVDMASGVKRPGQHNSSSPSGQSTRMPNMSSTGGSPIMSPISKSFNHPSPLNSSNPQGPIPPQSQQSQQPSYMPLNRLPGPPQPYTNVNPRYPTTNNSQISVASPKSVGSNQVNDRGGGSPMMGPQSTMNSSQQRVQPPQQQQQQQQPQQQSQFQQQFPYGQNNSMEMGFNPNGHPQNPQQPNPSGQTINFTQQHLRMGNQTGMPVSRMQMPVINRMGVPQRMGMPDMQQQQQQQPPPQPQQRPLLDNNQHPQRMMRPPPNQHPRHNMLPTHQQQMQMGAMSAQSMQQMGGGPGMSGQMMNRFPQMVAQHQQQGYSNMPIPGNPNNNAMSTRRPYGPGPGFQGMNPRTPSDQMLSSGSQNPHTSMGNPGAPHNEWMGNMNNMSDNSCPPYSASQRHPTGPPQVRPTSQQFHSGMAPNQTPSGPPQLPNSFGHDHMMGQQNTNYSMNVGAPTHAQQQLHHHHQQQPQQQQLHHHQQQQQQPQQQQLPPNFSQHASGPNTMKMGMPGHHHPQQAQQPQQSMYGNSNSGFGMKPPDNGMMCAPQNSMAHHQLQQQHHSMYNMGNMMNASSGQMNSNMSMSDHQEFDLNLLVDGMRSGGDQVDASAFNDDLLNTLDAVFH